MTYATKEDLIERFGEDEILQLTDELQQGDVDDLKLTRALADADADINGYLAGRYTLPLASTPPVIKRLACAIARYHLYNKTAPDTVESRYKEAIRTLEGIAKGIIGIGLDAVGVTVAPASAPDFSVGERVFSAGTLKDY
ncbi:MAG: DUF1320 domain-containing protein [Gammaproteobacteria bacterium]|nr:DUF1320 domain-containing protein [Gammaproteobacteria bacterium]